MQRSPVKEGLPFGGVWMVIKSYNSFKIDSPCTAAFCNMCLQTIEKHLRNEDNEQEPAKRKKSERRASSDRRASSIVVVEGVETGARGVCGHHTYADLMHFQTETHDRYCRRRRD